MTKKRYFGFASTFLLTTFIPWIISGCTTYITSEKFTGKEEGRVYCLPQPVITVSPNSEGAVAYESTTIPDRNKRYVVRASSFISNYTLDTQVSNCYLTKISLDAKSADAMSDLVKASGTFANSYIETANTTYSDQKKSDKTAEDAVVAAKLAWDKARAKLKYLQDNAGKYLNDISNKNIIDAEIEVAQARAAYEDSLRAGGKPVLTNSLNPDSAVDNPGTVVGKSWSNAIFSVIQHPVYFNKDGSQELDVFYNNGKLILKDKAGTEVKIDDATTPTGEYTVDLIAMSYPNGSAQIQFDTVQVPKDASGGNDVILSAKSSTVEFGKFQFAIKINGHKVSEIIVDGLKLADFTDPTFKTPLFTRSDFGKDETPDEATIVFNLPKLKKGKYHLGIDYSLLKQKQKPVEFLFEVK